MFGQWLLKRFSCPLNVQTSQCNLTTIVFTMIFMNSHNKCIYCFIIFIFCFS